MHLWYRPWWIAATSPYVGDSRSRIWAAAIRQTWHNVAARRYAIRVWSIPVRLLASLLTHFLCLDSLPEISRCLYEQNEYGDPTLWRASISDWYFLCASFICISRSNLSLLNSLGVCIGVRCLVPSSRFLISASAATGAS